MAFLKVSYHCYFLPTAPPSGTEGKKTLLKVAISTPWGRQRFGDDWGEDVDAENQIPQNEGEQHLIQAITLPSGHSSRSCLRQHVLSELTTLAVILGICQLRSPKGHLRGTTSIS